VITLSAPVNSLPALLTPTEVAAAARAMGTTAGRGLGTARLLAVVTDPLAEIEEVLSSLHGEPTLAARVLKVANSPFYHQAGTVGTLDRAVQVLGLDAIRGICAACCMDRVSLARSPGAPDPQRFRLHSLATAVAATHLARQLAPARHADAFIAGLLHDIGLVLLARLRPEAMTEMAAMPPTTPAEEVLQQERARTGMTHADCAAQLATAWSLPAWLVAAVGDHHTLQATEGPPTVAALVQAADLLAHRAGFGLHAACMLADGRPGLGVGASDELQAQLAADLPNHVQALVAAS
jgi:HD-like signal output (HDOD) protein